MKYNVAIVGATGLIGSKFLQVLKERKFPINKLYLYASKRSKGKKIKFNGKEYEVIELNEKNIKEDIDFALFSAGKSISLEFAKKFSKKGAIVIDNSSAYRMDKKVPLVVPEVNGNVLTRDNKLIANPNCSTMQAMPVLKVLHDKYELKRVIYSTYQAVSGAGQKGINDYINTQKGEENKHFVYKIYNNLIPHIDDFLEDGYTNEEVKMINETKKILSNKIKVTATCVRVPILNSHSVSINAEFKNNVTREDALNLLKKDKNVVVLDDVSKNIYPMPIIANDNDNVYVGRIREDKTKKNTLNLFVVSDNTRKGAATNAIQIAEYIIKKGLI